MTDAERYLWLRSLALKGELSAFVDMEMLDWINDADKIDACINECAAGKRGWPGADKSGAGAPG
jgi:hypothetical protein